MIRTWCNTLIQMQQGTRMVTFETSPWLSNSTEGGDMCHGYTKLEERKRSHPQRTQAVSSLKLCGKGRDRFKIYFAYKSTTTYG